MILQLKSSQGKGWSETDLKEALRQGVVTPTDIHTFGHQLKNFWGLANFFFGENSLIAQALQPILAQLSAHTLTFEAAQVRDKNFATKLGYAIDTRIFRWLQQCRSNRTRSSVNDSLLGFDHLIDQVLTDSFIQFLPMTFKQFSTTTNDDTSNNESSESSPVKKKPKTNQINDYKEPKEQVKNPKTLKNWLVTYSDYNKCFAAKNLTNRPNYKNRPMCQRWHSKGYCFNDCLNKLTHIPSGDLDDKSTEAYTKYVEKCRASN